MNFGKGYLTYAMGLLAVGFGLLGWFMGWTDQATSITTIWAGFTTLGVRRAIGK